MSGVERGRAEAVFEAALQLAEESRSTFIDAACGSNEEMARTVRALLAAHAVTGGLLERTVPLHGSEALPERIGVYRILGELGRGGMGVVYDAERDDGQFRRRVAIKLLRAGSDPELRQRVLAERQILAALDHPGIARLLDGGVAADGRPYLVMEHVEGLPIDTYCARLRLDIRQRLRLFCEVARVVEHAHRSLVVHRDLKPSNILVTADGRVKLLDFGIARLLNAWAAGTASPVTRERVACTPEYASPEQLRGEPLTTTCDVYALGIVLYELLTGRRPFQQLEGSPAHAQAVLAGEFPAASSVVAGPAARVLRGDIDAILRMALRPEPGLRYGSAEALAQDIERHLDLRRVHAREANRGYVLGKLIRRHARTTATVAVVSVALVAALAGAVWQARLADAARARAEQAMAESARITDFLVELFEAGVPEASLAGRVTARDLVDRGLRRVDLLHDQPALQAPLLAALGRVLGSLADFTTAEHLTQRALTIYESRDDDVQAGRMLAQIGSIRRLRGDYAEARAMLLRALDVQRRTLGDAHPEVGETYGQLAIAAIYLGDFGEAATLATESFNIQHAALGPAHRSTLNAMRLLGQVQRQAGSHADAEHTLRRVVAERTAADPRGRDLIEDQLQLAQLLRLRGSNDEAGALYRQLLARVGAAPDEFEARAAARNGLAALLAQRGQLAGAEELLRREHEERLALYGSAHTAVARSATALGSVLLRAGRLDEAQAVFADAAATYRATVGEHHIGYANALAQLAAVEAERGALQRADSLLVAAVRLRLQGEGPAAHGLADLLRRRAEVAITAGRLPAAESLLHEALASTQGRGYSEGVTQDIHDTYARLYRAWGRDADAAQHAALGRPTRPD